MIILSNGTGTGQPVNPFKFGDLDYSIFEAQKQSLPIFKDGKPYLEVGEVECELVWQQSDEDGEGKTIWKRCYNPLLATSDTRQVYRVLPSESESKEIKTQNMKTGLDYITEKRLKHEPAGYDLQHDKEHTHGELAMVASVLALHHTDARVIEPDETWGSNCDPWGLKEKYKDDPIGMLSEAGALIAAEIDRLQNLQS